MRREFYIVIFIAFAFANLQGQNKISPNYYKETFVDGVGLWKIKQLNNVFKWQVTSSGPINKDPNGNIIPVGAIDPPLKSGKEKWIILDSYLGGSKSLQEIDAVIISPKYDCTEFNDVFLKCNTLFRKYIDDEKLQIGISTDSINFEYQEVFSNLKLSMFSDEKYSFLKTKIPYELKLQFPKKYSNKSKIWIAFRYSTSESGNYSWQIDDIELFAKDPTPICDLGINDYFYAIAPYKRIPKSQVDSIPFLLDVFNNSISDKQNVVVGVDVFNMTTKNFVFNAEENIGTITKKDIKDNIYFSKKFLPQPIPATYRVDYYIKGNCEDESPKNNKYSYTFEVSEFLFQKEIGKPTRKISPDINDGEDWSYGNHFYIKKGYGLKATHISFLIENTEMIKNDSIATLLYAWKDINSDKEAQPSELDLVGFAKKEITEPNSVKEFSFALKPTKSGKKEVELEDETDYLAVVAYQDMDSNDGHTMEMLVNDTMFYYASVYASLKDNNHPIFNSVLKFENEPNYSLSGFEAPMVPMVRLTLDKASVGTKENLNITNQINIFPNPTSNIINIYNSDNQLFIENVFIKNVLQQNMNVSFSDNKIDLSSLENGVYFVELHTAYGNITKKIIKQN